MNLASLGIDFGVLNALNLWVACIIPDKDGHIQLMDIIFHEERPDLGEIRTISAKASMRLPNGVTYLVLPWCNYDRSDELWFWHAWVENASLSALPAPGEPVVRVPLGAPPSRLVRPALAVASGEFDVPFLTANGLELVLVRFVAARAGRAADGAILWRWPVADRPVAARAALGPAKSGSLRRIVLVFQEEEAVVLQLVDFTGGRPVNALSCKVARLHCLPGGEPGIRIDEKGATHVSILLASSPDLLELSIIDVIFPPGGGMPQEPRVERARKIPARPIAAGIAYQARPDRPMRRDWVAVLADGSVVHSLSRERPMRPRGKPGIPLEIVALSQATYLLTLGLEGPILETLH